MSRLIRPLRQWPQLQRHVCYTATSARFVSAELLPLPLSPFPNSTVHFLSYSTPTSSPSRRRINLRSRRPLPKALVPTVIEEGREDGESDADSDERKSRNQRKRDARRAVRWGMELASFSNDQIRRILRAASLDEHVFDALMLVKRLGSDVREGKRRQFNFIGKLLREVEPDLMDTLIDATKHGDRSTLQALVSSTKSNIVDNDEDNNEDDIESESEDEDSKEHIVIATRWFDGLISKNVEVTKEVYSLQTVDFDRQELRKLVRKVHSVQEQRHATSQETETGVNAAVMAAEKSLTRFLRALVKQMPNRQSDSYS